MIGRLGPERWQRLSLRDKLQRHAVVAPALSRRCRAVAEHVTLVAATAHAVVFGSRHDQPVITLGPYAPRNRLVKLGQPVPLSYFVCEVNSGRWHAAHT